MENQTTKKLRRTIGSEKMLFGVCGGVAKYFGIDVTLVRVALALSVVYFGTGLWLYLILAFILPKELLLNASSEN